MSDDTEYRYKNALEWVRFIAGAHYLGGAFDPEHMRDLYNVAADALDGCRDLPDYEEATERAQRKAGKMARQFSKMLANSDDASTGQAKSRLLTWLRSQEKRDNMVSNVTKPIRTILTGSSPLMMNNVQRADPDNTWAKAIDKISRKRVKTEEDRKEIYRLEFLSSVYTGSDGRIVIPKANIKTCFKEAAKAIRKGRDISRALNSAEPEELHTPLMFADENLPAEELWKIDKYHDMTIVTVRGKIPRCRPVFNPWALRIDWLLITSLLDLSQFRDIAEMAGIIEGLGDNRVNGNGRFKIEIKEL